MGKGRKQQDYQFDEASSGSDDSDSDSDEDGQNESLPVRDGSVADNDNPSMGKKRNKSDNNSDNDDDGSDDSSVDSENEETSKNKRNRPEDDSEDGNSDHEQEKDDDDDDGIDSSENEEDAPLHQRLVKKEGRGSLQRSSRRERKSKALEEATKRLASFRKESHQRKKRKNIGGDNNNDEGVEMERSSYTRNTKSLATTPAAAAAAAAHTTKKKKKSKNKPTEVSSKRADFFARGARRLNESGLGVDIGAHRYKPMDPRVSNLSGHFDEDRFHNNYAFLEELRNKEIGEVRKRITAHKATGNKGNRLRRKLKINDVDRNNGVHSSTLEDDVARLKALTETRANLERRKIDRAAKQSVKRKIRGDVESGKTGVYFLKRKEQKRLELEARFEEIRKRGGEKAVEKILAKKRQKNKSRDASGFAK
jgi:ribosomal RNA-processing protein 36